MDLIVEKDPPCPKRVYRTVAEKRRIVERILEGGLSVAQVAREEGVNSNQLHRWRREYQAGLLPSGDAVVCHLLPVQVESPDVEEIDALASPEAAVPMNSAEVRGSIRIEIEPARTAITAEHGADPSLLRIALEALGQ
jgi:transposase-like protein